MNLITVEGLTHSYTDRMLFKEASFSLNEHEKVGIIGINGTDDPYFFMFIQAERSLLK